MLTEQQARDLLHLAADTVEVTPAPVALPSRRRVRPLMAAVAASVVLVLGGGAVVKRIASDDRTPQSDVNPLTTEALRNYDPQAMPSLMDERSRAVFSRSVIDLPASVFKASAGLDEALPPERYHQAHSMEVFYPLPDQHELWFYIGHGKSHAEGDAKDMCSSSLQSGWYVTCEVRRVGEDVAMVTVSATADGWMGRELGLRPSKRGDVNDRQLVPRDELDAVDSSVLMFERTVKVVHSDTFVSVVKEAVSEPDLASAQDAFVVPVADMLDLATDPTMVIPEPSATIESPSPTTESQEACPSVPKPLALADPDAVPAPAGTHVVTNRQASVAAWFERAPSTLPVLVVYDLVHRRQLIWEDLGVGEDKRKASLRVGDDAVYFQSSTDPQVWLWSRWQKGQRYPTAYQVCDGDRTVFWPGKNE